MPVCCILTVSLRLFMTVGIRQIMKSEIVMMSFISLISSSLGLFSTSSSAQNSRMEENGIGSFGFIQTPPLIKIQIIQFKVLTLIYNSKKIQMEDKTEITLQSNLSRTSSYLLGLAEVKGNSLEQQILMLFNSKYAGNDIKKLVKLGSYAIETLNTVFKETGMFRVYTVVKRVSDSLSNICNHVIQILDKTKTTETSQKGKVEDPKGVEPKERSQIQDIELTKAKLKINKLRGVCLFNQNYKRKIDSLTGAQEPQAAKAKKVQEQKEELNQKEFKRKLFIKMKNQLKEVEEDLYCPMPDEITTFMLFEKRFLQNFNHVSHSESIENITAYLQSSRMSALELLGKSEDMSEQISKFRTEIELLLKQTKNKTKERNQNISQKFQIILKQFLKKRKEAFQKTQKKLNEYRKMFQNKEGKQVSIGVETHLRELGTLKGFERKVFQIEERYKAKDEERQKGYRGMIQKNNLEKAQLMTQVTQFKITNKTLNDEIIELKKQNSKILEKIYEKREEEKLRKMEKKSQKQLIKSHLNQNVEVQEEKQDESKVKTFKQKRTSVRLSNLSKIGAPKEEIVPQQANLISKPKPKKVVSIKQIDNDSKTNTMINYEDESSIYTSTRSIKSSSKFKIRLNQKQNQFKSIQGESKRKGTVNFEQNRMTKSFSALEEDQKERERPKSKAQKTQRKKIIRSEDGKTSLKKNGSQSLCASSNKWDESKQRSATNPISQKVLDNAAPSPLIKNSSDVGPQSKGKDSLIPLSKKESPNVQKVNGNLSIYESPKMFKENRFTNPSAKKVQLNKLNQNKKLFQKSQKFFNSKLAQNFQFTNVYSISLNQGSIIQFQDAIQTSGGISKKQKFYDLKGNPIQYSREILTQLIINDQEPMKYQFRPQLKSKRDLKLNKLQSSSLHETSNKLLFDLQKKDDLGPSEYALRVKSLLKQGVSKPNQNQKENLNLKKKLIKHLQTLDWNNRRDRELSIFKFKQESSYDNLIFHSKIKLKENQKLKKIKRKKEELDFLVRNKKILNERSEESPSKLPQIKVKSIF